MAADGVNVTEDAEMAECDGDKVVTMMDVLQEQQDFEEDANAVLGASDDKNCTYPKGYIKRQALYACLTCCTEAKTDPTKRAGVCLACSLTCHENHELVELYTKRNFRCDCGNPKFNSHPCQFTPDKTELNDENIYNQNFSGLYCICNRPYPDPESTIEDDMIQCIICEDWLHASHLEAVVPPNDQYSEMICKGCMEKNEFLHDYSLFAINVESGDVDVITVNGDSKSSDNSLFNGELEKEKLVNGIEENGTETNVRSNGEVEMSEDKEDIEGKATDTSESAKIDESIAAKIIKQTKLNDSSTELTESKSDDTEKLDNVDDSKMDLDTESKKAEQDEQSMETTCAKTNEPVNNDDTSATAEDSNVENETSKNASEVESEDKLSAAETTSEVEQEKTDKTSTDDQTITMDDKTDSTDDKTDSTDDKTDSTDEKIESIDSESQKMDEAPTENTETLEQNTEQSTKVECGNTNNAQENVPDTSDKTEQQLLDDLNELTADNQTLVEKKDTATEETAAESTEQSKDTKKTEDDVKINNEELPKETTESEVSSEEKPVSESETATGNIEVPDTSQTEKENTDDKTDSVMDAIDELLQTANEPKQSEVREENKDSISEVGEENKDSISESTENKDSTSESTENKENTDVAAKETSDVEMSTSEDKIDNEIPGRKEETFGSNDKTNTEDVEMSDSTAQNKPVSESSVSEDKVEDDTKIDSETKDTNETETSDSKTVASVSGDKVENESPKDLNEKSEVTDTVNENISKQNETETELQKTADENSCANVSDVTENTKEHKRKLSTDLTEDVSSKKAKLECVRPKGVKRIHKGATFWPSIFRQKLCTCGECLSMYKDLKVLFLTDLEDTVFAYESLGKQNVAGGASQYEKGLEALSSLDRIQQINALTEYNRMRDKLLDFLKSFKDRKEVVKEEDIKAFFAGMKPRREPDGVYFCR